jgi:hypothetical protein
MPIAITLSFTELIVVSALVLSVFLLFIQFRSAKSQKETVWSAPPFLTSVLSIAVFLTTMIVFFMSFYPRGDDWFILRVVSLSLLAFYSLFKPRSQAIPVYLLLNVAASCIAPVVSLGFSAGDTDQVAHMLANNLIINTGHVTPAQEASFVLDPYYQIFPVADFLASSFSLVTGANIFLSFALLEVIIPVVVVLALILVTYYLTKSYVASVFSVLILLATDRLALWTFLPQDVALYYALFAFLPLAVFFMSGSRIAGVLAFTLILFANFAHASLGGLFLLSVPLVAAIFRWQRLAFRFRVEVLAASLIVGLATYWTVWNITNSVGIRVSFLLRSILNAFSGKVTITNAVAKQSLLALFSPYAFLSWSLPAALTLSYVGYYLLARRFRIPTRREAFLIGTSLVSFFILVVGLYSSTTFGSVGLERYSDVPAYSVFAIVGSVAGYMVVQRGRKVFGIVVIALLVASLVVGGAQLNWAPERVTSTYGYASYQQYQVTHTIASVLPGHIVLYYDEKLDYIQYWNFSKLSTDLVSLKIQQAIDANRSTSSQYMISSAQRTDVYYLMAPSLVTDYNSLVNSPHVNVVFSDGQDQVAIVSP